MRFEANELPVCPRHPESKVSPRTWALETAFILKKWECIYVPADVDMFMLVSKCSTYICSIRKIS